ncbi:MAG TPA: protein kinase [Thermoanaerobaculia bacterium]|nr:protein kinase [Thermoanaerobaculia bacterium]
MTKEPRFGRLRSAFDRVQDLASTERDEAIRNWSGDDSEFEAELRALLAAAERSTTPLDTPPLREVGGSPESPEPIPGYRILQSIGRGGSATVYLAEQLGEGFTRQVALKVLGRWVDASRLRRFRAEQSILAALEHPGIARLYDAGLGPSRQPYLAMELVRGVSLIEHCERTGASLRDRLGLFLEILRAVEHAHASSVVHRDLKPGNILVSERGEPKLLDFGIARLVERDAEATETQHRAMTPAYASPEQVRGAAVERASDLYSLGVVLYELLTGRRPYPVGNTSLEALERAIRESDPEPAGLGADLDAILSQALRKEPAERYASASDFAADLRRYLDGRSVLARRGSLLYRIGKGVRRKSGHWVNAALAALLLASLALWLAGFSRGAAPPPVDPYLSPWLALPVAAAAEPSYARGLDALSRYDTTKAIENLAAAVARDPEQPLVRAALATAHSRAGHDALARTEGRRALLLAATAPRESRLWVEAAALDTAGQKTEEAKLRRTSWLLAPGNFEVGFELAESLVESGEPGESLAVVAKLRVLPEAKRPAAADLRLGLVELEALNALGRPQEAALQARGIVTRAGAHRLDSLAARALLQESLAEDGLGQPAATRALAEQARKLFERQGEPWGAARAFNYLCIAAARESRHEEAERLCAECARRHRRVGSWSGTARAIAAIGMSRQRRGLIREARAAYAQALALESRSPQGDRMIQARYLHNLANLDSELGRLPEAEDGYRRAIEILREGGNELSLMRSLSALAIVLTKRGALGEAETALAEGTNLARRVGSPRELGNLLWQGGNLARDQGDSERARRLFDQAAGQLDQVPEAGLVAHFEADRGRLAEPSPRVCSGLESSEKKLARLGDWVGTEIAVEISRCWSAAGSIPRAQRWLDRAAKAATGQMPENRVELELARGAVELGRRRWPQAERALATAAAHCREGSLGTLLMETRLLQTQLARARGDHPERVRTLAEELERDAKAGRFGRIARQTEEILRAPGSGTRIGPLEP